MSEGSEGADGALCTTGLAVGGSRPLESSGQRRVTQKVEDSLEDMALAASGEDLVRDGGRRETVWPEGMKTARFQCINFLY